MTEYQQLLEPFRLTNELTLKNKIVMAPMTRAKATDNFVATDAMASYYARRADAGLIVTEGTIINPYALGHRNVPGIYTEEQINAWRKVTDAVHQKGGVIFLQIWHVGRVSHPSMLDGMLPVSASKTTMKNRIPRSDGLFFGESRALTVEEINQLVIDFKNAAENAMKAGFDGVEIHGANGYLIDQFMHYDTNHRQDDYGGASESMSRFPLEIVKAIGDAIGYSKVGIRLSPGAYLNEINGSDGDRFAFEYLLNELGKLNIAYVHTGNFDDSVTFSELGDLTMTQFIRKNFKGVVIACGGYSHADADAELIENKFDLIAFGKRFIANPNLISRLKSGEELIQYDVSMLKNLN